MIGDNGDRIMRTALDSAIKIEYKWADSREAEGCRHEFSPRFMQQMSKIGAVSRREYVSFGKYRVTRFVACALICVLLIAMAGCGFAVHRAIVHWKEINNEKNNTLDVLFETEGVGNTVEDKGFIKPRAPEGFHISRESKETGVCMVEYSNIKDNITITYLQQKDVESIGLSIDNDDEGFRETTINGFKGYVSDKEPNTFLVWSNGIYLYTITGNCPIDVLWRMTEELI